MVNSHGVGGGGKAEISDRARTGETARFKPGIIRSPIFLGSE